MTLKDKDGFWKNKEEIKKEIATLEIRLVVLRKSYTNATKKLEMIHKLANKIKYKSPRQQKILTLSEPG